MKILLTLSDRYSQQTINFYKSTLLCYFPSAFGNMWSIKTALFVFLCISMSLETPIETFSDVGLSYGMYGTSAPAAEDEDAGLL